MTVTTAPVKSFDSLRECASNERVTTNRKPKAAKTLARIMMMSQIKVVVAPVTRSSIVRCQRAYTSTQLSARRVEFTTEAQRHREGYSKNLSVSVVKKLPQPHDPMLGTRILRCLDQAIDQLRSILCVEVKTGNFPLLQRLVRIQRILDHRGMARKNLFPSQLGLRRPILQPADLVAHLVGCIARRLHQRGIQLVQRLADALHCLL